MRRRKRLGRAGSTAVEFAIVSAVFLPLCLAIMQLGVILWAQGTLQSTASQVARCAAISSPLCNGSNSYNSFTASTWSQWIFTQITGTTYTTVQVSPNVCVSPATSAKVKITCTYWNWLINPFVTGGKTNTLTTMSATAYFPSSATTC